MIRIIIVDSDMSQVSRYPLSKSTETRIFNLLWQTIANLKEPSKVEEFFSDLLTPTEKIIFSKRLAIAVMLLRSYDYESIRATLQVSSGTIGAVSLWLKYSGQGYRKTVEKVMKKEKIKKVIDNIDSAIELLVPEKTFSKAISKGHMPQGGKEPF